MVNLILECVAVLMAILYLVLAAKEDVKCWYAALISSLIYIYIMYQANLFMESILQVFYVLMAIYGWLQWKNPSNFQPKPSNSSSSISKRATVFLETSNYKHVRETFLGGKQQQQQQSNNNVTTKQQVTPKERNSTFQTKNIVTLSRSKRGANTMENTRRKNTINKRIRVNGI